MLLTTLKQRLGFAPKMSHLLGAAQLALVAGLLLPRLNIQLPVVDMLTGMLIGFSIVGNFAALVKYSRQQRENGDHHG